MSTRLLLRGGPGDEAEQVPVKMFVNCSMAHYKQWKTGQSLGTIHACTHISLFRMSQNDDSFFLIPCKSFRHLQYGFQMGGANQFWRVTAGLRVQLFVLVEKHLPLTCHWLCLFLHHFLCLNFVQSFSANRSAQISSIVAPTLQSQSIQWRLRSKIIN